MNLKSWAFCLLLVGVAIFVNTQAAGFALQNQNGAGTGYAYAGASAVAEDASTIYFNPAGLTYLPTGQHISAALTLLEGSSRFEDHGSSKLLQSYPLGNNGGDAGGFSLVPAGFAATSLTPEWRIGIGLSPTFGSATEWSEQFVGRYQAVSSDITAINVNPSIAWQLNDVVSLGAGLDIVKFDADLQSKVPATALLPNALVDVDSRLKGDGLGFGFNLGALLQLTPATRLV